MEGLQGVSKSEGGNYLYYGVREFGMTAIANGIGLHGGFIPYTATFLVFSDYARNAIRMAALMKQRQIMVYTHDSIGLGEDGPTHQPVEHVASLRLIPNLDVWRPADATETAVAWAAAIERTERSQRPGPLPPEPAHRHRRHQRRDHSARAVTFLPTARANPRVTLIATGSEVKLALDAQAALAGEGIAARVVSVPCTEAFDRQGPEYRNDVLGRCTPRVAIEAGPSGPVAQVCGRHGASSASTASASRPRRQTVRVFRVHGRQRRRYRENIL